MSPGERPRNALPTVIREIASQALFPTNSRKKRAAMRAVAAFSTLRRREAVAAGVASRP